MADYNIPDGVKYYKEHEWVKKLDDGSVLIGISDYAQQTLTDITYVGFKGDVGDSISTGDIFGEIESVKSVSDLFSPMSGEILEQNDDLEDDPEKVNSDPYDAWIIKLKPSNFDSEWADLMDAPKYSEYITSL
ncbi:MAG: glycine cleavage system protein GcvH [Candidatus Hodarchaeales archaeon]|jgi:glycine cleavage system H protein